MSKKGRTEEVGWGHLKSDTAWLCLG